MSELDNINNLQVQRIRREYFTYGKLIEYTAELERMVIEDAGKPDIPEGYAIVPIEPTDVMIEAYFESANPIEAYKAMTQAAQDTNNE